MSTAQKIPVLDKMQVIRVLSENDTVCGLLCLNAAAQDDAERFVLIRCKNVIYATGGPAGMYADSVYPFSQYGATGLALEAGGKRKKSDRMAVWPCFCCAALECFRYLYAGVAARLFHRIRRQ